MSATNERNYGYCPTYLPPVVSYSCAVPFSTSVTRTRGTRGTGGTGGTRGIFQYPGVLLARINENHFS